MLEVFARTYKRSPANEMPGWRVRRSCRHESSGKLGVRWRTRMGTGL